MLAEINGYHLTGPDAGKPLSSYTEMKADGSTAGGCWIYTGVYADGVNQAARRVPQRRQRPDASPTGAGPGRPTGASSTTERRPTPTASRGASARSTSGGTRSRAAGSGHDVPDFPVDRAPHDRPDPDVGGPDGARRRRPVHHAGRRQGLAVRAQGPGRRPAADALRAAGVAGRTTRSTRSSRARPACVFPRKDNLDAPSAGDAGRRTSTRTCSPPTGSPSTTPPAA